MEIAFNIAFLLISVLLLLYVYIKLSEKIKTSSTLQTEDSVAEVLPSQLTKIVIDNDTYFIFKSCLEDKVADWEQRNNKNIIEGSCVRIDERA